MKQFKCSVCGYIHTGDNPPEHCPICGSTADKFILLKATSKVAENDKLTVDMQCDLAVIGSGAAALSAAIFAHAQGLKVIVLEKADNFGGTTARSGGRYWIPNNKYQKEIGIEDDKDSCLKYMVRYSYPALFDPNKEYYGIDKKIFELLEVYYDNASKAIQTFEDLKVMSSEIDYGWQKKPFADYQEHLEDKLIRGRTLLPKTEKGHVTMGSDLVELMLNYLKENNVEMYLDHEVINIIKNNNKVEGVIAMHDGQQKKIFASEGVFFGTGGFSHNADLMNRFQPGVNYGGCAVPTNTGDLVSIAEKNNIKLGNMDNAFRVQSILEAYLANPEGSSSMFYHIGDSTFQVNRYGKRVMDEKRNYNDRTWTHFIWDANKAEWPNRFLFMIFDSRTANLWQGFPPFPVGDPNNSFFVISGETIDQLSENINKRLMELKDKVFNYELDPSFNDNLKETINNFNEYAKIGKDLEFSRGEYIYDQEYTTFPPTIKDVEWPSKEYENITLHPISETGPYYAIILAAGTLDTNGGVMINKNAKMVDGFNKPIAGLYGSGNCTSGIGKAAYYGAGATIGPAITFAYIAVNNLLKK